MKLASFSPPGMLAAAAALLVGCAKAPEPASGTASAAGASFTHRPLTGKLLVGEHRIEAAGRATEAPLGAGGPPASAPSPPLDSLEVRLVLRQDARPPRSARLLPRPGDAAERTWSLDLPRFMPGTHVEYHLEVRHADRVLARIPPESSRPAVFAFDLVTPVPRSLTALRAALLAAGAAALAAAALLGLFARAAAGPERARADGWTVLLAAAGATLFFAGAVPLTWITRYLATGHTWAPGAYRAWGPETRAAGIVLWWALAAVTARRALLEHGPRGSEVAPVPRAFRWMLLAGCVLVALHLALDAF